MPGGDDRELVLGYIGAGEFIGEMGLFVETHQRGVALRTRTACELAEISYERLQALLQTRTGRHLHPPAVLDRRANQPTATGYQPQGEPTGGYLDVSDRIYRTLFDLAREPEAMTHPMGTQLRVSRQELARLVGCSREMAGRVLKKLQADGKLHARGKTVVVYSTRWPFPVVAEEFARMGHAFSPNRYLQDVDLRNAVPADADDVAQLLAELGYPCELADAAERISMILANDRQALVLARRERGLRIDGAGFHVLPAAGHHHLPRHGPGGHTQRTRHGHWPASAERSRTPCIVLAARRALN